jgi:hypothetical protein
MIVMTNEKPLYRVAVLSGSQIPENAVDATGVTVFTRVDDAWELTDRFDWSVDFSGPDSLRTSVRKSAEPILGVTALLTRQIGGLAYNILDRMGFNVFEAEICDETMLDALVLDVRANNEKLKAPEPGPGDVPGIRLADGTYVIDLNALQAANPLLSSKAALRDVMSTDFSRIELFFDHVPHWLANAATSLGVIVEQETDDDGRLKITITNTT